MRKQLEGKEGLLFSAFSATRSQVEVQREHKFYFDLTQQLLH